jgi:SAM-dependent methyltransferase
MVRSGLLQQVAEKGTKGTLRAAWRYARDFVRWKLDAAFDRRYGVDTSGKIHLSELKIDSLNLPEATWYEPVSPLFFRRLMRGLSIDCEKYVFIDYGSGKGRALFLASEYSFAQVLGVEFSPELHSVAVNNIRTYVNPMQRCFNIVSVCIDAVDFELPHVPSVLFFYSPFKAPVFIKIMNNVMESIRAFPRSVYILFVGFIPESIQLLKNSHLTCREIKLNLDYIRWERKVGLILHSGISRPF